MYYYNISDMHWSPYIAEQINKKFIFVADTICISYDQQQKIMNTHNKLMIIIIYYYKYIKNLLLSILE